MRFAITQPVLDVTGRSPEFFVFHRASRADILMLLASVTLLPAVVALGVELAVGLLGRRARRAAHLGLVARDGNRVELCELDSSGGTPRLRPIRRHA